MSKELKYKVGERLLLEVVVTKVDEQCDDILPYKVGPVNATDDRYVWVNEDELFQQLEAIPAQQSQTIDANTRAMMAATILSGALLRNELSHYGLVQDSIVLADAIISELNKNSK